MGGASRGRSEVASRRDARPKWCSGCCTARSSALSRELGVTAATLAQWRERFLAGGQASLRSRPADDRDDEIRRLQAKAGAITMDNELLLERAHRLEAGLPLAPRRSRR